MFQRICVMVMAVVVCGVGMQASAQPLADKVPADAMLYIGWQGIDQLGAEYEQSRFKAILDESGYKELVGPFFESLMARISEEKPGEAMMAAMVLDLLKPLRDYPSALYAANIKMKTQAPPSGELALIVHAGDEAAALRDKLMKLPPFQDEHMPLKVHVRNGYLLLLYGGIEQYGDLTTLLDGGVGQSLKTAPKFIKAAAANQPKPLGMLYLDLQKSVRLIDEGVVHETEFRKTDEMGPSEFARAWPKLKQSLALDGLHALSMSMGFIERDFGYSLFIHAPTPRKGLAAVFGSAQPVQEETLRLIPATSMMAGAATFDLKEIVDFVFDFIGQIEPQERQKIDRALAEVAEQHGVHPVNDLVASMGSQWAYYADQNVGGSGLLGTVFVNRLRDPEKFSKSVQVFAAMANDALSELGDSEVNMNIRQSDIGGKTIYHLSIPYLNPSILVDGNRMYVGLYPQVVVSAANWTGKDITTNPQFVATHRWMDGKKFASVDFIDSDQAMVNSYANVVAMSQLGLGFADMSGVETPTMLIPPLDRIRPHLSPSAAFSWTDDQGMYFQGRGPLPGMGIVAVNPQYSMASTAMMAGVLLPAVGRAREIANRTVSASNMAGIYVSCYTYSVTNDDKFPPNLGVLIEDGSIHVKSVINPDGNTHCPPGLTVKQQAQWVNQNSDYLYFPGEGANMRSNAICLMHDPDKVDISEGMNICFGDGRVEWLEPHEVSETIRRHNGMAKDRPNMPTIPDPYANPFER